MTAIHQFVPSLAPRDAIGGHVLRVQELLRDMGLRSEIYVREAHRELRRRCRPYERFRGERGGGRAWLLYQFSTGSPMAEYLLSRPEPKLSNYHNVTPSTFFEPWEPHVGTELDAARRQLAELAPQTELAVADSSYNESELVALGYRDTEVVPILVDTAMFDTAVDDAVLERLLAAKRSGGADLLFVGRVAPHKAQHEVIKAFALYRRQYDPAARLHLVGASSSHAYSTALASYVEALGLEGAVDLTGPVSHAALAAHFRAADVFVCLSRHEGFCVPLLEALHHGLPVVALGAGAVPETLGAAGLVLESAPPATVAAAVHRVVSDARLRDGLAAAGRRRLAEFGLDRSRARFRSVIERLLDAA